MCCVDILKNALKIPRQSKKAIYGVLNVQKSHSHLHISIYQHKMCLHFMLIYYNITSPLFSFSQKPSYSMLSGYSLTLRDVWKWLLWGYTKQIQQELFIHKISHRDHNILLKDLWPPDSLEPLRCFYCNSQLFLLRALCKLGDIRADSGRQYSLSTVLVLRFFQAKQRNDSCFLLSVCFSVQ